MVPSVELWLDVAIRDVPFSLRLVFTTAAKKAAVLAEVELGETLKILELLDVQSLPDQERGRKYWFIYGVVLNHFNHFWLQQAHAHWVVDVVVEAGVYKRKLAAFLT